MFDHPLFIVTVSILFQLLIVFIVLINTSVFACPYCESKMKNRVAKKATNRKVVCDQCQNVSYIKGNQVVSILIFLPLFFNIFYKLMDVPTTYTLIGFLLTSTIILFAILPYSYKATKENKPLW